MRSLIIALCLFGFIGAAHAEIVVDENKKYPDHYTTGPNNDNLITIRCPGAKVIIDYDIPSPGGAAGRDLIFLNPKYIKEMPWQARLFMFAHECGHLQKEIDDDESEADHFAVKKGVAEGWLKREHLKPICEDYGDAPADGAHPSGRTRCLQNARWFEEEIAKKEAPPLPEPKHEDHPAENPKFDVHKHWWQFW